MSLPIAGPHLVRYGTPADQKYLVNEFRDTYDQLIVNANILAHMPGAITTFISQHAKGKPFLIDPQTHAFQHDLSALESQSEDADGRLKRSIAKLLEAYGDPVKSRVLNQRSVLPSDFASQTVRAGFCERVLKFQFDSIQSEASESPTSKYFRFLERKGLRAATAARPTAVVAPYFYLAATTYREWLKTNVDCARDAAKVAKRLGAPLGVQIVLSKDVLVDDVVRAEVIEAYSQLSPGIFLLWVDDLVEQGATKSMLEKFIELVECLGARAPVVNLYGGYFSIALLRSGRVPKLAGVSHGLEYGESRAVTPVGGGIPVAKYYLPGLHDRLAFRDALRAVRQMGGLETVAKFHSLVCDCKQCVRVVRTDPEREFALYGKSRPLTFVRGHQVVRREFPLPETKENSVRHYLWCKRREFTGEFTASKVAQDLRKTSQQLGRVLGLEAVAYCDIWAELVSGGTKRPGG
jgi:hypothetical protein